MQATNTERATTADVASSRSQQRRQQQAPVPTERNLYSIVLIDVAGSAALDSRGYIRMRDDLYGLIATITREHGLDLEMLPYDDTGDGLRLVIPLNYIEPTRVVDAFVLGLAAGLREHRRLVSPIARIRMRVGFDLGLIEAHRKSWTGTPLVRAARLVDAEPVRQALLVDPDADLVAVVSDAMYESIVRHRFGHIAPESFREIQVKVKEYDDRAWLLAPGSTDLLGLVAPER